MPPGQHRTQNSPWSVSNRKTPASLKPGRVTGRLVASPPTNWLRICRALAWFIRTYPWDLRRLTLVFEAVYKNRLRRRGETPGFLACHPSLRRRGDRHGARQTSDSAMKSKTLRISLIAVCCFSLTFGSSAPTSAGVVPFLWNVLFGPAHGYGYGAPYGYGYGSSAPYGACAGYGCSVANYTPTVFGGGFGAPCAAGCAVAPNVSYATPTQYSVPQYSAPAWSPSAYSLASQPACADPTPACSISSCSDCVSPSVPFVSESFVAAPVYSSPACSDCPTSVIEPAYSGFTAASPAPCSTISGDIYSSGCSSCGSVTGDTFYDAGPIDNSPVGTPGSFESPIEMFPTDSDNNTLDGSSDFPIHSSPPDLNSSDPPSTYRSSDEELFRSDDDFQTPTRPIEDSTIDDPLLSDDPPYGTSGDDTRESDEYEFPAESDDNMFDEEFDGELQSPTRRSRGDAADPEFFPENGAGRMPSPSADDESDSDSPIDELLNNDDSAQRPTARRLAHTLNLDRQITWSTELSGETTRVAGAMRQRSRRLAKERRPLFQWISAPRVVVRQ